MKTLLKIIAASFITISSMANAAIDCNGTINTVYVTNTGEVITVSSWNNKYNKICNVNQEWKGVATNSCKAWLSISQTAKLNQSPVRMQYANESACDLIPNYGDALAPSYLMLKQ